MGIFNTFDKTFINLLLPTPAAPHKAMLFLLLYGFVINLQTTFKISFLTLSMPCISLSKFDLIKFINSFIPRSATCSCILYDVFHG